MKRNLILFGTLLSAFLLIFVPNVGCVNSIVQKDDKPNFKDIRTDVLKKTENILNRDCGCKDSKSTNTRNYTIICDILHSIIDLLVDLIDRFQDSNLSFLRNMSSTLVYVLYAIAVRLECNWWDYPLFK